MKKKLVDLIKNAPFDCSNGAYQNILIIPSGKRYNGFWGKNGYEHIILLGFKREEEKYYRIDKEYCNDSLSIELYNRRMYQNLMFDIPRDLGCIRIWAYDSDIVIIERLSCIELSIRERKAKKGADE